MNELMLTFNTVINGPFLLLDGREFHSIIRNATVLGVSTCHRHWQSKCI